MLSQQHPFQIFLKKALPAAGFYQCQPKEYEQEYD